MFAFWTDFENNDKRRRNPHLTVDLTEKTSLYLHFKCHACNSPLQQKNCFQIATCVMTSLLPAWSFLLGVADVLHN
jgi:hypothetical protein